MEAADHGLSNDPTKPFDGPASWRVLWSLHLGALLSTTAELPLGCVPISSWSMVAGLGLFSLRLPPQVAQDFDQLGVRCGRGITQRLDGMNLG
jgi:hypothetical protein